MDNLRPYNPNFGTQQPWYYQPPYYTPFPQQTFTPQPTQHHGDGLRELIVALENVNKIHYLGQPSFASKMLRMLDGDHCGVLDSLVSGAAKYPLDQMSFALYSVTLQDIARELDGRGIANPRGFEKWRAADADAAIFAKIRGWRTP